MKKIISLVLTLTLLMSVFNGASFITNAGAEWSLEYNGLYYWISNGEVTIADYNNSATTVTIPSEIESAFTVNMPREGGQSMNM